MLDGSKMSWREIREAMASNPSGTETYKIAKSERNHRIAKYVLITLAGGLVLTEIVNLMRM